MDFQLTFGFAFCAIVLLLCLRYTVINWKYKASLIMLSLVAVIMFYNGLINALGWPANYRPSETMLILSSDIHENEVIYIWYINADKLTKNKPEAPRAISIPYDKEIHKKLSEAAQKSASGSNSYMRFGNKNSKISGDGITSDAVGTIDFVPPPFRTIIK